MDKVTADKMGEVLDYYLGQSALASVPDDVVRLLLEIKYPERTFFLVEEENRLDPDDECVYLQDFVDAATGEEAGEIFFAAVRLPGE